MADTSESTLQLCSLITENDVHAIHTTFTNGDKRFMVWTRLSEHNSSWILNISDGVDVWKLELDEEHLQSHKELAEIEKYETYFSKFRSEFQSGNLCVAQLASKVTLTVGSGLVPLIYDLYEAKASEKKVEMQAVIFRLADNVTELTQKLKVATESLERLKAQKGSSVIAGPSIFDVLPKKSQAPVVKRKQGHSLINPGSRNVNAVPASLGLNPEGTFHLSILTGNQALDVYKCSDANCQYMCSLCNKRYHCPLCDNKPQKPGRMRRHFMKMHSGKQLVQHGRFRMLRCKLKCTRANGRITENSHYHCCLCGRVLIRKVHLYCHLQAHSFGTADDVGEDAMDAGKDEEEPEDEADVDDDEAGDSSALDTSHVSGIASSQPENVVALTDGTQVVYVQSIQSGETLAVVPIDGHPENLQLSQVQQNQISSAVTTSADLSAQLQVLTSSADTGQMPDLGVVPQDLPQGIGDSQDSSALAKQVEAILNQGEENVADLQITDAGDQTQLRDLSGVVTTLEQFTGQQSNVNDKLDTQSDIEMPQDTDMDTPKDSEVDSEPMEFGSALADLSMTTTTAMAQEPNQMLDVEAMAVATEGLANQATSLDLSSQLVNSTAMTSPQGGGVASLQSSVLSISTAAASSPTKMDYKFTMLTSDNHEQGQGASPVPHALRKPKASIQDSLVLLETNSTPKGDDEVFKFIVSSGAEQACCCYNHPSVLVENQSLDIGRCKNTDCDCRLYHCPLCTCLPNKPGRIREHFKKIHAEELIIRYKGLQMLRCKLGCSRPNGKKVFNSHYHCCVCGHICIRKSGLYEHMRVQHAGLANKNNSKTQSACCGGTHSQNRLKKELCESQGDPSKTYPPSVVPVVVQLSAPHQPGSMQPEEAGNQPVLQAFASQGQAGGAGNQQAVTVQIPSLGDGQSGTGQQLVIVMPQQTPQGQVVNSGQSQQPIVIVMPQIGHMAQPVVIPMSQNTSI